MRKREIVSRMAHGRDRAKPDSRTATSSSGKGRVPCRQGKNSIQVQISMDAREQELVVETKGTYIETTGYCPSASRRATSSASRLSAHTSRILDAITGRRRF